MAKGITQDHVSKVADNLLLAGERPTIERVRQALGTGSPNTVNRLLDIWWIDLGQRLTQAHSKVSMPEAPVEISNLASQLWEQALASANVQARVSLDADWQALAAERTCIMARLSEFETQIVQQKTDRDIAIQACEVASTRLIDLLRLADQQSAQLMEVCSQRDRALSELAAVQTTLATTQSELQQRQNVWNEERSALEATHTAMQDRWLGEVDRARQDEAKMALSLKQLTHTSELSARKAAEQMSDLRKQLLLAEREEIKSTAKIATLQEEITRVHAQLKSRLLARPIKAATLTKKLTSKTK